MELHRWLRNLGKKEDSESAEEGKPVQEAVVQSEAGAPVQADRLPKTSTESETQFSPALEPQAEPAPERQGKLTDSSQSAPVAPSTASSGKGRLQERYLAPEPVEGVVSPPRVVRKRKTSPEETAQRPEAPAAETLDESPPSSAEPEPVESSAPATTAPAKPAAEPQDEAPELPVADPAEAARIEADLKKLEDQARQLAELQEQVQAEMRRRNAAAQALKQATLPLPEFEEKPKEQPSEEPSVDELLSEREQLIKRLADPVLTLKETAKLLGVCTATVRRYTNKGLLEHFRTAGGQRRFRLSQVLKFMREYGFKLEE